VQYVNCSQEGIKAYLEALTEAGKGTGSVTAESLEKLKPYAEITALDGTGYQKDTKITIDLSVYSKKLTSSNLYVIVSEPIYTGSQVKPDVTVYYGEAADVRNMKKAVQDAGKAGKTLTDDDVKKLAGTNKLTLLKETDAAALAKADTAGGYTLSCGANVAAGKNKGTVTITGTGIYGGSVTVKFTIKSRTVYEAKSGKTE
jgi:hypothetical protein